MGPRAQRSYSEQFSFLTPMTPAVTAIVAVMNVAIASSVAVVAAFAGVTQVQVDASRVVYNRYAVNEAKANTMIFITLEQGDVMSLLAFPLTAVKWYNRHNRLHRLR